MHCFCLVKICLLSTIVLFFFLLMTSMKIFCLLLRPIIMLQYHWSVNWSADVSIPRHCFHDTLVIFSLYGSCENHQMSQNLSAKPERFSQVSITSFWSHIWKCSADGSAARDVEASHSDREHFLCFFMSNICLERNLLSSGLLASRRTFPDKDKSPGCRVAPCWYCLQASDRWLL